MKIQCDVCERAPATVVCCADEAALCAVCDGEVHAANKLASKHQRLPLHYLSGKLPKCDICQEKTAFIFCVEDRALFCEDCDEPIHSTNSLSRNHQRFLATGIRLGPSLSPRCAIETKTSPTEPPNLHKQLASPNSSVHWTVDDFLCFSEFELPNKKEEVEFGELEWFYSEISRATMAAAEVPQLSKSQPSNTSYRPAKPSQPLKKAWVETSGKDEYFTVPDLG